MKNTSRHFCLLGGLSASALIAGCFLFPPGNGSSNQNPHDGSWTVTETQMNGNWCVVIQQNEIADHDDGCTGTSQLLLASAPGTSTGSILRWTATVRFPNQGNIEVDYTYDVKEQLDGSLAGDLTRTIDAGNGPGPPDTLPIVMSRN